MRILIAAHPELLTPLLRIIHGVIAGYLLKQAGLKRASADTGAVTLIQRFGSAANLNIHLHCLVLDGTTHIVMTPLEFMQRLAALVPRPRLHLIRFHGVLAPNAGLRAAVVPGPAQSVSMPGRRARARHAGAHGLGASSQARVRVRPGTLPAVWR